MYTVLGNGPAMVRFVQEAIGAGSCVLLAAAGMALFGEWGAVAGVLLAIYPAAIFLDGLLDKSALISLFTVALLYLLSVQRTRGREFLAGVTLGLLSLTRENALLLAVPVLLWFLIGDRRPAALLFLAGCAVVLLPVGARNYADGGEFELTTSQFGPNFYIGNHAGADGRYDALLAGRGNAADEQEDATQLAEQARGRALKPDEVSSYWTGRTLEFIRTQPGDWLRQLARKLALTFNASEVADTESQDVYGEWSSLLRLLAPVSFGVIFCLGAFGICMTAGAFRRLWFLHAIALTYTASIVIFYVFARYRFPLAPMLMLFAAGGVAAWRESSAWPRRGLALAAALVAAVLAGVLAYQPLVNTRLDRIAAYTNIGNSLLLNPQQWDEAGVFYEKALKESPQSPAAHYGMGMLLALKHQPKDAIPHYRTAVVGWPDNADIRLNFALALSDSGDNPAALEQLGTLSRLRPDNPTADLLAGKLLLKNARPADALKAYDAALAIQPKNADALMGSGVALTQLQRPDEAIDKYRQVLKIDPRNADAHDGIGYTLQQSGRLEEAIREFQQALSLNPKDQDAQSNIDQAREKARREAQAVGVRESTIQRPPSRAAMAAAIACAARGSGWRSHGIRHAGSMFTTTYDNPAPSRIRCRRISSRGSSLPNCGMTMSGVAPRASASADAAPRTSRVVHVRPRLSLHHSGRGRRSAPATRAARASSAVPRQVQQVQAQDAAGRHTDCARTVPS